MKLVCMNLLQIGHKLKNRKGQAMTEYGLLIALIAVAVIAVLTLLGGRLVTAFNKIIGSLPPS